MAGRGIEHSILPHCRLLLLRSIKSGNDPCGGRVTDRACRTFLDSLVGPAAQCLARTDHQARRGWRMAIGGSLFPRGL